MYKKNNSLAFSDSLRSMESSDLVDCFYNSIFNPIVENDTYESFIKEISDIVLVDNILRIRLCCIFDDMLNQRKSRWLAYMKSQYVFFFKDFTEYDKIKIGLIRKKIDSQFILNIKCKFKSSSFKESLKFEKFNNLTLGFIETGKIKI